MLRYQIITDPPVAEKDNVKLATHSIDAIPHRRFKLATDYEKRVGRKSYRSYMIIALCKTLMTFDLITLQSTMYTSVQKLTIYTHIILEFILLIEMNQKL